MSSDNTGDGATQAVGKVTEALETIERAGATCTPSINSPATPTSNSTRRCRGCANSDTPVWPNTSAAS